MAITRRVPADPEGTFYFGPSGVGDSAPDPGCGGRGSVRRDSGLGIPYVGGDLWTSRQRAACRLHEVPYRACFKPQLVEYFISRFSSPGDRVYDPFMGRGTTLLEAALMGRKPAGCDVNPLAEILIGPRLGPPSRDGVARRLAGLPLRHTGSVPEDLLAFFHPYTLAEICALRRYILDREESGELDPTDAWIRMVATTRLTGHSPGFFSVYTLPPNQAVTVGSQRRINRRRAQKPPRRDVRELVLRKTESLLRGLSAGDLRRLGEMGSRSTILSGSCESTPPFLDVVDYRHDNWLRCWFNGIDAEGLGTWQFRGSADWSAAMRSALSEVYRVLVPGGHVAFEVGEIRSGNLLMESLVVPVAIEAGFSPLAVLVNEQAFTKTANIWGVSNRTRGTNTNRVVLLRKPG